MNDIIKLAYKLKEDLSPFSAIIVVAGSVRRKEKDIKDIDFVCVPEDLDKLKKFIYDNDSFYVYRDGEKLISFVTKSCKVDIYFATEDNFGAMLLFLTGSGGHNIGLRRIAKSMGFKLNQYGLWLDSKCIASKTEEDIYNALNREYKAPELRK